MMIVEGGEVRNFKGIIHIAGTSYQGEINLPYRTMVRIFGKPNVGNDGYKTDAEWHVMTPTGPASIYNYKDGKNYCGRSGTPTTKLVNWHIGGRDASAYAWVDLAVLAYLNNA